MADWQIQVRAPGPGGSWTVIPQHMDLWYRLEVNALSQITFSVPQAAGISAPNLFWNMETLVSGLIDDISTNNNNGTITGTPNSVTGQVGLAREFTNTNAGAITNTSFNNSGIGTYSIVFWFKQVSAPVGGFHQVLQLSLTTNPTVQFTLDSGGLHLVLTNSVGTQVLNQTILSSPVNGTFYHICITYDGSTVKSYTNGSLTNTFTSITAGNLGSSGIKIQNGGSATAWDYIIDEVYEFQSTVLTQNQVLSIFNNTFVSPYLSYGNEVRVIDPSSVENVRGMIRESTNDPILKTQKVICSGKAVRLQDRVWQSRRTFPTGDTPQAVFKELMQSAEGEPSAGRVIYYDGETLTNTGLLADLSTFGNNGTFNGSATTAISSGGPFYGQSLDIIDTATAFVNIPNSTSFDGIAKLSIFFWFGNFATGGFTPAQWFVFNNLNGNSGYSLFIQGVSTGPTTLQLKLGNGTATSTFTSASLGGPIAAGWHHLGVTYDGANVKFWMDNAQVGASQPTAVVPVASGIAAYIGKSSDANTLHIYMDEFYIYNRAISTSEINILFGTSILEGGLGTISASLPTAPPRIEGDRRLQVVDSYTRALGAEWYVDQNASDQDRLNVVSRVGSSTSTQTFQLSKNCSLGNRQLNNDTIFNDITIFGVGDGPLQLESRNFSATTIRDTIATPMPAGSTAPIPLQSASTTAWPTNGVVFVGMERIQYTGKDATHLGSTSITRAYQADGITSFPSYTHQTGLEIYLSSDTTTTPATYYTSSSPQVGSQIFINGLRNGVYTDKTIVDQNTLDFLAYNFNIRYNNPRESLQITVPTNDLTAVLGDAITINDSSGNPFASTPYRIIAMEWDWDSKSFRLELLPNTTPHASGGYVDSPSRRVNAVQESASDLETYGVINDISVSSYNSANITVTTNTEKITVSLVLNGVKNGTKLVFLGAVTITTGTATTDLLINLRRGNLITSPLVGTNQGSHITAAGQNYTVNGQWTDLAYQDNPIYSLSIQQISATGNGNVFSTCLWIENSE